MKKSRDYKISVGLLLAAIVSFCVSGVTGLVLNIDSSIDTMFMFLGFALMGFGFVFLSKSKGRVDDEDK